MSAARDADEMSLAVSKRHGVPRTLSRMLDKAVTTGYLADASQVQHLMRQGEQRLLIMSDGLVHPFSEALCWCALRTFWSWSLPCREALDCLKKHSRGRVLELGSGSGYWGAVLRASGMDTRLVDNNAWEAGKWWGRMYAPPDAHDAHEELTANEGRLVLAVYPDESLGDVLAQGLRHGDLLAVVLDRHCTGSRSMWRLVDNSTELERFKLPRSTGAILRVDKELRHEESTHAPSASCDVVLDLPRAHGPHPRPRPRDRG